jgi:hypothetical protein
MHAPDESHTQGTTISSRQRTERTMRKEESKEVNARAPLGSARSSPAAGPTRPSVTTRSLAIQKWSCGEEAAPFAAQTLQTKPTTAGGRGLTTISSSRDTAPASPSALLVTDSNRIELESNRTRIESNRTRIGKKRKERGRGAAPRCGADRCAEEGRS